MPDPWNFSQRPQRSAVPPGPPATTFLLCAICVLVTLAESFPDNSPGTLWYALGHSFDPDPFEIWSGRYYELLTAVFPHSNLVHGSLGFTHLLFNVWWLAILGSLVEAACGPLALLAFCMASAAVGSAAELLWSGSPGIGMSGVVYALFGMMWASKGRFPAWDAVATRDNMWYFIVWGVFCLIATYVPVLHLRVANAAHFGGLLFGLAVGYVFFAPRRRPGWIGALLVLTAMVILAATWMPWNSDWQAWHANPALALPAGG